MQAQVWEQWAWENPLPLVWMESAWKTGRFPGTPSAAGPRPLSAGQKHRFHSGVGRKIKLHYCLIWVSFKVLPVLLFPTRIIVVMVQSRCALCWPTASEGTDQMLRPRPRLCLATGSHSWKEKVSHHGTQLLHSGPLPFTPPENIKAGHCQNLESL